MPSARIGAPIIGSIPFVQRPQVAVTSASEKINHISIGKKFTTYDIATDDNIAFEKIVYSSGSVRRPAPCFPTCKCSPNMG
jgi:hypothetical protein